MEKNFLITIRKNQKTLKGILLGYGKENSYFFHERFQLNNFEEVSQFEEKHYIETKQKIIEFYKGKDFLETTLRLLAS